MLTQGAPNSERCPNKQQQKRGQPDEGETRGCKGPGERLWEGDHVKKNRRPATAHRTVERGFSTGTTGHVERGHNSCQCIPLHTPGKKPGNGKAGTWDWRCGAGPKTTRMGKNPVDFDWLLETSDEVGRTTQGKAKPTKRTITRKREPRPCEWVRRKTRNLSPFVWGRGGKRLFGEKTEPRKKG